MRPRGRFDDRAQALEQGALAGPAGPDQADHLAGGDRHVHVLERIDGGVALAVALAQAFDADAVAGRHLSLRSPSAGSTLSAARMASVLASAQIDHHDDEAAHGVARLQQHVFRENRRPEGGGDLADHEADQPQPQRLLQDHAGDGAVARADQLQHGDLADLAQRHGVDDEGDDGGADDGQNDQEHADLPGRGGDQLGDQDLLHLRARVGLQALPAADGLAPPPRRSSPRRSCTSTALTLWLLVCEAIDGLEQAGHAGAVERRVGGGARALVDDGVVVLEELRLLRVLERDEHHRVAAGGHHAPGQADHGVVVAADADAVAELRSRCSRRPRPRSGCASMWRPAIR